MSPPVSYNAAGALKRCSGTPPTFAGSIASRSGANGDGVGAGGGVPSTGVEGVATVGGWGVIPSERRSSSSWFGLSVGVADGPDAMAAGPPEAGGAEQAVMSAPTRVSAGRAVRRRVTAAV